ncbi:unnamed protein product [Fusarium graminearum]|uniref:Uncharacterized protein n=1 Tax=Gibberella zeae TaxID=5518 RepID=A0A2H3HFC8_GIBZA|nr:hypothetical protein HG531_007409 [Fusarium graminearum]PCD36353.1 hypothetical protein FGRA07_08237 [Fusarium graminearum]CAF3436411.1 unnamed protein product [Fusarium graminearum]CAF3581225.1 unnamed protein product [Fusarium graminearum]CAG1961264.1 unnamed protein product [Fusarium graminearum]
MVATRSKVTQLNSRIMAVTRSMTAMHSTPKSTGPSPAGPSSPTTSIRSKSPLQTPKPPAAPLKRKRKRSRDANDSPVPLKLRKEETAPQETSYPQSSAGSDATAVEADESEDEQCPPFFPKLFEQDATARDWSKEGRHETLKYFQAFPHDRDSTLCVEHFLILAEKWYWERKPTVSSQLNAMPRDTTSKSDLSNLALPICEETWTVKDVQSFKDELSGKISQTRIEYIMEYYRVARLTGHRPKCEIFDATSGTAFYSMCAKSPDFKASDYSTHNSWFDMQASEVFKVKAEKMVGSRRSCPHERPITILGTDDGVSYTECEDCRYRQKALSSQIQTTKHAIDIAGVRFPVSIAPAKPMTMNSKVVHIDVGGIHVVVDHCKSPLIRFRSTRFSELHEKEGFDHHVQGEIQMLGVEGPDGVDGGDTTYTGLGAFEPSNYCTGSFHNCACY